MDAIPASAIRDQCRLEFKGERCTRVVYNKSEQLCQAHNLQRLRGQEFKPTRERSGIPRYMEADCSEPGCNHPAQSRGLCTSHYYQLRNSGEVGDLYTKRRAKGSSLLRNDEGEKECAVCSRWLSEDNYGYSKRTLDGLRPECRECRAVAHKAFYEGKTKGEARGAWLKRRYGKTPEWFDETLKLQGDSCAVCKTQTPGERGWQVDHDHSCCRPRPGGRICGQCIRGILCSRCNLTLGQVKDDQEILKSMIDYLKENTNG